ncbi:Alpha-ketoglutarate-dependent dioxygenase alkB homolog 4 [Strongyloides ratti]|uniref:Alpha-ketoglutarate-dependent dioxygenase alkB homolog 4 n=1 Tax=Strongyloides ratti TaxID=34506 RepID=A0A090LBW5_STRRB|nr:Alpha-ketoglutarate-dependent dioxygenase alkB homolog 4 [Strongyloides ratti]CEF67222.1 Alpha-ketoglutarate-dependent dioxygenase alkB homolog 4 [Strongyloides ratti]
MSEEGTVKCGCKGVRFCRFCKDSERVKRLNFEDDPFKNHTVYVFSSVHKKAFLSELSHQASREEIVAETKKLDSSSFALLKDKDYVDIGGLLLFKDFINDEEEKFLVDRIDKKEWKLSQSGRRKQDYGPQVAFKYQKVKIHRFVGMPDYSDLILQRMKDVSESDLGRYQPFELCNLEYDESRLSSIDMHKDDTWIWGNRLISLNLINGSIMTLEHSEEKKLCFVDMPRRSMLCMFDDSRYVWNHAIFPKHIIGRRIALTMREPATAFLEGGEMYESFGKELIRIGKIRIPTI